MVRDDSGQAQAHGYFRGETKKSPNPAQHGEHYQLGREPINSSHIRHRTRIAELLRQNPPRADGGTLSETSKPPAY